MQEPIVSVPELPNTEFTEESQSSQRQSINELSAAVISCAIEVQRHLGTGLLESAYGAALAIEMSATGLRHEREVPVLASYKGTALGVGYRADIIIEDRLLLELKAIDSVTGAHRAQVLSYLRLSGLRLGLLINFHAAPLGVRGVSRVAN